MTRSRPAGWHRLPATLRAFAIGLLAFALSMQGVATATMASHVAGVPTRDATSMASMASMSSTAHCHGDADVPRVGKARCGTCASCGAASALPAGVLAFAAPRIVHAFTAEPRPRPALFLTGGLDRPPRPTPI